MSKPGGGPYEIEPRFRVKNAPLAFHPGYGYEEAQREEAMKITCIGTDPAALYLGILLKRRDPSHAIRFVEDPYAASHEPASLICNPLKPRLKLVDAPVPTREPAADADQATAEPAAAGGLYGGGSAFNLRPALATPYTEPRTDLERTVARTWATVLGIDRVGAHDDFFDLGGESLLAMQLITRLRAELGVSLSVRAFFDAGAPTVAVLAGLIEESRDAGPATPAITPSRRRTATPTAED